MRTTRKSSWRGRFFEDFEVGDHFEHPLGRTITEADNAWFTLLTMNTNELHFNDHYAEQRSMTGRQIVNSGLTVAMVLGISVSDISQNAIANLGWTDIELLHPVLVGDTLYADSLVTGCRRSASRPHAGIVECLTRGINQHGDRRDELSPERAGEHGRFAGRSVDVPDTDSGDRRVRRRARSARGAVVTHSMNAPNGSGTSLRRRGRWPHSEEAP
jgi:itaconyl-CoA hydratase